MAAQPLFQSFFMGGFECSSHLTKSGQRLDLIIATGHETHAAADYQQLCDQGIATARDGIRWHLVEPAPGSYDFTSVLPLVRAARDAGVQVIWDLCHYGWPNDLDVFTPAFVQRCAALARSFARLLADETDTIPTIVPVNEISFLSWVAAEIGHFYPCAVGRGYELKRQLVRASIASIEAIWEVIPGARIAHTDPVIYTVADPGRPEDAPAAAQYRQAQFQAWDMICGRLAPELGGHPRYLDIIGVNYYPHNQWIYGSPPGPTISRTHPLYRPFRHILRDVYARYGRPLFVAETSSLNIAQPDWLRYVGSEVRAAMRAGVPVEGLCVYPIIDAPDWDDECRCHQGLWSAPDADGQRTLCEPLARELRRQQRLFAAMLRRSNRPRTTIAPARKVQRQRRQAA